MNPIKYNTLFLLSLVYTVVLLYTQSETLAYGYAGIILVYSVINFDLGLMAYLMITPLTGALEISVFLSIAYSVIPCIIYSIKVLNGKEKLYKSSFGVYLILLSVLSLIAMLATKYFEYFHVLALLILVFSIAYIIVQRIMDNKENVYLIANSFIISGLSATIIPYLHSEMKFGRLALGDSIRQLSNSVGMALILLLVLYFFQKQFINSSIVKLQSKIVKRLRVPISIILVIGLTATMSRGVIFALGLGFVLLLGSYIYKNIKKRNLKPVLFVVALFFFIGFVFVNYGVLFLSDIGIESEKLIGRLSDTAIEDGTGIRQQIWKAGFAGLEGWQVLYGHGISSFKMLASQNGYDYYAHSVFVDTLVTTGFLGFSVLMLLLIKIAYKIIHSSDYTLLALFVFLIFGYITHGTIFSTQFWFLLSVIYGLSFSNHPNIRKKPT